MKKKATSLSTFGRVFRYIGRYKLLLFASFLLALLSVAMTLYVPILIGNAVDTFVDHVSLEVILPILLMITVLVLLTAVAQWLMNTINNRITYHVVRDVRNDAFSKLQRLPLSYLDSHPTGDIVSRMIADVDQFSEGLLLGFTQFFTGLLTILGTLAFMLTIHPLIALLVVVLTPLSLFIARFIASRTHSLFDKQARARGRQTAYIEEMVGNAQLVSAFSRTETVREEFDEINEDLNRISVKAIFFSSLVNPTTRFVNSVIYAAIGCCGVLAVLGIGFGNPITVGALSSLLSYTTQYTKPFNEISGVIAELQNALACAGRVFDLLEEKEEVCCEDPVPLKDVKGNVSLSHVSFSYDPDVPLIEDLSLRAFAGKRVAIVGPTGCGKTTLINLLMRFYDPLEGEISVDGVNVAAVTREDLRRHYGMVLQETWLSSASIRDNIRMGRPEATEAEVIEAAKAAHAHSFIKRLPNGYDTLVAENGSNLSAGQRQLLCIARVMLTLPPMLILDEATSSIDTRTELRVQRAFAEMMKGRTVFVVAHRLSTVKEADLILVMKDGSIIEQGTHDELLAEGGFYRTLYNSQFEHA